MGRSLALISMLLAGLLVQGCRPPTQMARPATTTSAGPGVVVISGSVFNPVETAIKAGDTVTWINEDTAPHTVAGNGWDSGNLKRGDRFSRKFDAAGTYDYSCAYHPNMKGRVTVG